VIYFWYRSCVFILLHFLWLQKYHYLLLYLCSLHTCDRLLYILKKLISYLTPEYLSEFSSSGLLIVKFVCMGSSVHLHYVEGVQGILMWTTFSRDMKSQVTTLFYKYGLSTALQVSHFHSPSKNIWMSIHLNLSQNFLFNCILALYGAKLRIYNSDVQNIFLVFTPVAYNTEDIVHITVVTVLGVRVPHNMAYEHLKITHIVLYTHESPSLSLGIFWACLNFEDLSRIPPAPFLLSRSYVALVLSVPLIYIIYFLLILWMSYRIYRYEIYLIFQWATTNITCWKGSLLEGLCSIWHYTNKCLTYSKHCLMYKMSQKMELHFKESWRERTH